MQLLDCINDRTLSVGDRHIIDVICFDFAFDTVNHTLRAYGFLRYIVGCTLCDLLKGCVQRVVLHDGVSEFHRVMSGVPRRSAVGPVLFVIYINDIVDLFGNNSVALELYADDLKVYLETSWLYCV